MNIPVTFELEGKVHVGTLEEVHGAGGTSGIWHLMIDKYYWGRLRNVRGEWFFDENKPAVGHLKEYFVAVIIAWYE